MKKPDEKEIKSFMEYAMGRKWDIDRKSRELLTATVVILQERNWISKETLNNYLHLTKKKVRAIMQQK